MSDSDKIAFSDLSTIIIESSYFILLMYTVYAFSWVKEKTDFPWVKKMILLCLIGTLVKAFGVFHDILVSKISWIEWIITFIDVAGFWGFYNVVYWMFAFKYWVIGKEMNRMLMDDDSKEGRESQGGLSDRFWTEERYSRFCVFGICTNILVCCALGCTRAQVNLLQIDNDTIPKRLNYMTLGFYLMQSSLLFISACFLGRALMYLGKQFSDG